MSRHEPRLSRLTALSHTLSLQFLTTFVVSLMKSIDIRSDSAIKLLAEFLDMDPSPAEGRRHANAEHFAHGKAHLLFPSK